MANELDYNSYPYYPEACEILIPITLKVPIMIQPEVIGKPPVCHTRNGHYPVSDAMPIIEESKPEPAPETVS